MSIKLKTFNSVLFPAALILVLAAAVRMDIQKVHRLVDDGRSLSNVTVERGVPTISDSLTYKIVDREEILNEFFNKYNSPLAEHTDTFIKVADRYGIDYRLLPAISCIESSCGKRLIPDSYNPFGWGIHGNTVTRFSSYDEAIEKVGAGLNNNYFAKGLDTPEKIAPVYNPPTYNHWLSKVWFFFGQIDNAEKETLSDSRTHIYDNEISANIIWD